MGGGAAAEPAAPLDGNGDVAATAPVFGGFGLGGSGDGGGDSGGDEVGVTATEESSGEISLPGGGVRGAGDMSGQPCRDRERVNTAGGEGDEIGAGGNNSVSGGGGGDKGCSGGSGDTGMRDGSHEGKREAGGGGAAAAAAAEDEESDEEPECRVCRGGDEGGARPLAHPCRCRGSIKYVHQDCLVEWLRSRGGGGGRDGAAGVDDASALQAQRCELCREKLVFRARYRPGAPAQLGVSQFVRGAMRRATPRIMDAFRGVLNLQMWGLGVPILFCLLFRIGLGLGLLFARELAGFFGGRIAAAAPGLLAGGGRRAGSGLPGLERIGWSGWMDVLGDWCGGVGLVIGVMCLGPPCVELAIEFVTVVKALPIVLERWWLGGEVQRVPPAAQGAPGAPAPGPNDIPVPAARAPRPHLGNHPPEVGGPPNEAAANMLVDLLRNHARNEILGAGNDNQADGAVNGGGGGGGGDRREADGGERGGDEANDADASGTGGIDSGGAVGGGRVVGNGSGGAGTGEGDAGREEGNGIGAAVDRNDEAGGGNVDGGDGATTTDARGADAARGRSGSNSGSSSNPAGATTAVVANEAEAKAKGKPAQVSDKPPARRPRQASDSPAPSSLAADVAAVAAVRHEAAEGVRPDGDGDEPRDRAAEGEDTAIAPRPPLEDAAAAAAAAAPQVVDADANVNGGAPRPAGHGDDVPGDGVVAPAGGGDVGGGAVGGGVLAPLADARAGVGGGGGAGIGFLPGEDGVPRGGLLVVLDRVEWFLAGVLEQLAAPPRDEEVDGEALFPWGWPAVGAAGSFLALMGLLLLFAQTIPYATYHAVTGAIGRGAAAHHHHHHGHPPHEHRRHPFWLPSSLMFRDARPPLSPSSMPAGEGRSSPPAPTEPPFSLTPRRASPDWSAVFRPSPAAESALLMDDSAGGSLATRRKLSVLSIVDGGSDREGGDGGIAGWVGSGHVTVASALSTAGSSIPSPHRLKSVVAGPAAERGSGAPAPSAAAAARAFAVFASAAPEDGVHRWYSIDEQLAVSPAPTSEKTSSSSSSPSTTTTITTPPAPGRRALPGRLATGPRKSSRNGSSGTGSAEATSSSRAESSQHGRKPAGSGSAPAPATGGRKGAGGSDGDVGGKHADEPARGAGKAGDAEEDEWYAMTLVLLRGPVIPGTAGLRVGAVFWDTVQGYCLLGLALLALVTIYSAIRLRWIVLALQLEVAIGVDDDVNAAAAAGAADEAAAVRRREEGGGNYQPGGAGAAAGAAAAAVADGGAFVRGRDALVPGVAPRFGGPGGPAGGGRLWMRGLGAGAGGPVGEVGGGGGMLERDGQIGLDLKVFTMGLLELVILPVWVGIAADVFSLPLLGSSLEARVAWAAGNPFSSLALHWGAGSMAVGVVSCLGKEIGRALKPNLLPPWANRPAEQGLEEVLVRMTHDPFLLQLASFFASAVAYPVALALMVMVPTHCRPLVGPVWRYMGWAGLSPVVLGIGEPTQGDRLGMDLVIVHFILPVVMEHLKIRGPVRRAACWVLMAACGVTGTRKLLLHPALLAGRGTAANDPDELDDIVLPPQPPAPLLPAPVPEPVEAVVPGAAGDGPEEAVDGRREEGANDDNNNLGNPPDAAADAVNALQDGGGDGGRSEEQGGQEEKEGANDDGDASSNAGDDRAREGAGAVPVDDESTRNCISNARHLDGRGHDGRENGEASAAAGEGGVCAGVVAEGKEEERAIGDDDGGEAAVAPDDRAGGGLPGDGRAELGENVGARGLAEGGDGGGHRGGPDDAAVAAPEDDRVDEGADEGAGGEEEVESRGRGRALHLAEAVRVSAAGSLVCLALVVLPAVVVLLPLLSGRALFEAVGLPLDDDLPPLVAGGLLCSALAWALSALLRLQVGAGEHRRLLSNTLLLAGKWLVIGALLMGVLPGLTGLLVHDALRGPLPPTEETAVMTWGKIWALGLVCVKLWARCVLAGAVRDETWQGRLRRVRANGFRGVDFKFTLMEVCFPLLDRVGQFYFWPHLVNRFLLPLLIEDQRVLRVRQKATPFVFFLLKAFWAAATFGMRKMKALHDLIRDDEYLVGLELENMPAQGHVQDAGGEAPSG
eukprot:g10180.t2